VEIIRIESRSRRNGCWRGSRQWGSSIAFYFIEVVTLRTFCQNENIKPPGLRSPTFTIPSVIYLYNYITSYYAETGNRHRPPGGGFLFNRVLKHRPRQNKQQRSRRHYEIFACGYHILIGILLTAAHNSCRNIN
jgi:hypothetical protein